MNKAKESKLEASLGYTFKNKALLAQALTHRSFAGEQKEFSGRNNERLEFLGDAFFDAIISDMLYHRLPVEGEGRLSKLRAQIVCEDSLSEAARGINLGSFIYLGKGEILSGGRERNSILADALEAVAAAIYIDGGFESLKVFIGKTFALAIDEALAGQRNRDYKTAIQEKLQSRGKTEISYTLEKEEGPDHNKKFYVSLHGNGVLLGKGKGTSKKEAEQNAAKEAIDQLQGGEPGTGR